jgi:hypothetical protein
LEVGVRVLRVSHGHVLLHGVNARSMHSIDNRGQPGAGRPNWHARRIDGHTHRME